MAPKKSTYAPANYGSVAEALVGLYGEKVRGAEQQMLFDRFTTSLLSDAELLAKPMVLLLGQYSAGKTTFIRYLAGRDFPGIHIGPEPTTDGFAALMDGTSPTPIPGNAATADKRRPFRALSRHGAAFLNKFCISELRYGPRRRAFAFDLARLRVDPDSTPSPRRTGATSRRNSRSSTHPASWPAPSRPWAGTTTSPRS